MVFFQSCLFYRFFASTGYCTPGPIKWDNTTRPGRCCPPTITNIGSFLWWNQNKPSQTPGNPTTFVSYVFQLIFSRGIYPGTIQGGWRDFHHEKKTPFGEHVCSTTVKQIQEDTGWSPLWATENLNRLPWKSRKRPLNKNRLPWNCGWN